MLKQAEANQLRSAPLEVEEITDPAALEALQHEWSALFDACPQASPFQAPEWLLPWRRAFAPEELWTLAVRRSGRLVGLLPLFICAQPEGGWRQLTLLGNGISDRLDLLARPVDASSVAEAALRRLGQRQELWDCADLRDLPEGSHLISASSPMGAKDRVHPDEPCPVVGLPSAPGEVLAGLPRKQRENLRRRRRRAEEAGEITFETADADGLEAALRHLLRLHALRWRARGEAGVLDAPELERFHREAAAGLQGRGLLRLHTLRLAGQAIAAQYVLQRGRSACAYINGFDPEFSRFAPAALLLLHAMEAAAEDGAVEFDFLRGREPYKYDWGALDRRQFRRRIWRREEP